VDRTDLVRSAARGDRAAFDALLGATIHRLYAVAERILRDPDRAGDAVQEALVLAWHDLPGLREPERFDAWLQRVAVNAARMTHRSRRRRGVREIPQSRLGTARTQPVVNDGTAADARVLDAALRTLDVEQRSILVLHHLEGRSVAEIAAMLDVPIGTVKSRLHTARRELQAAIDAETAR
jgi:RNA polymerase sigma-70 factor (ECF subfamily)